MEDTLSVKSNESLPTSDEFDFLSDKPSASKTPTLDFKIELNELRDALSEVNLPNAAQQQFGSTINSEILQDTDITSTMTDQTDGQDIYDKKVGQSTFYAGPVSLGQDPLTQDLSPVEKQDSMKADLSSEDDNTSSKSRRFDFTRCQII